jgi:U32 family peptidase
LEIEDTVIEVGQIVHFFSKINVAVVELKLPLAVEDRIAIKGPNTDFEQIVESMQIDHRNIPRAEGGQSIGLKLFQSAKEKDTIYKKL